MLGGCMLIEGRGCAALSESGASRGRFVVGSELALVILFNSIKGRQSRSQCAGCYCLRSAHPELLPAEDPRYSNGCRVARR